MDKLVGLLVIGIVAVLKLVLTGFFLVCGFRLGGMVYDKISERIIKSSNEKVPQTAPGC